MKTDKLSLILLVIGGFIASYAISPGEEELALIYLKDGNLELSAPLYVRLFEEDPSSKTNLYSLTKVFLEQGEVEKTIQVHNRYLQHNPNDIEMLEQLAELYKESHQQYKYMLSLEMLLKKNPSFQHTEALLDLYEIYDRKEEALAILKSRIEQDPSRHEEYRRLIGLQLDLKDYFAAENALAAYFKSVDHISPVYIEMRLRLLLSTNRVEKALDWIKTGELDHDQLLSIYYSSSQKGHKELSLEAARQIHAQFKGLPGVKLFAQTLFDQNRMKEVVTLLEYSKSQNGELSELYKQALMQAWASDPKLSAKIVRLWKKQLDSPGLDAVARRQIAFKFLSIGRKEEAVKEFRYLAEHEGPEGKNVIQLLYMWGAVPKPQEIDWIERRAKSASNRDLEGWLRFLSQYGENEKIIVLTRNRRLDLHPDLESAFLIALAETGKKKDIEAYLFDQEKKSTNANRIEKLAEYAHNANLAETAKQLWQQLAKKHPHNQKANYNLGLIAFSQGDFISTESYLKRYLDRTDGDWESAFYLGEAMRENGHVKKADAYFRRSLLKIENISVVDKRIRITRAIIFHRLIKPAESIREFESLVEDFPSDKQLRADYSTILIEQGYLDKG